MLQRFSAEPSRSACLASCRLWLIAIKLSSRQRTKCLRLGRLPMGEILSVQPDRLVGEHRIESVQRTTILVRAFLRGLVHLLMRPQHIFKTSAKLFISPTGGEKHA